MHQKATGLRGEFHLKKLASLGNSAIETDHTSCFGFVWFFFPDLKCVTNVGVRGSFGFYCKLWGSVQNTKQRKPIMVCSGRHNSPVPFFFLARKRVCNYLPNGQRPAEVCDSA